MEYLKFALCVSNQAGYFIATKCVGLCDELRKLCENRLYDLSFTKFQSFIKHSSFIFHLLFSIDKDIPTMLLCKRVSQSCL